MKKATDFDKIKNKLMTALAQISTKLRTFNFNKPQRIKSKKDRLNLI